MNRKVPGTDKAMPPSFLNLRTTKTAPAMAGAPMTREARLPFVSSNQNPRKLTARIPVFDVFMPCLMRLEFV
jgi:hypothetical protein